MVHQWLLTLNKRSKWLLTVMLTGLFGLCVQQVWAEAWPPFMQGRLTAVAQPLRVAPQNATLTGSQMGVSTAGMIEHRTHRLTNTGPTPELFKLTITSRQQWPVTVMPTQVQLAPGESITVTTALSIPNDTPAGTMGVTTLVVNNTPPAAPILLPVIDTFLVQGDAVLKIPPTQWGELIHGQRVYTLTATMSTTEFLPGLQTPTLGYNGSYLGPTLVMTTGEVISVSVTNLLTDVTTVHWHGLHLPGKMDGGPHQLIQPGATWRPTFTMLNEASTPWYHPHPHAEEHAHDGVQASAVTASIASTGKQVYGGLAGMILVRDSASAALGLPHTYGVDEFPIVVQDRNFNADGSFREYPVLQDRDLHKGDHFLINGTLAGTLQAPAQWVRLHLLNGANARFYNFGFADNRSFYQIASDNALLNQRVERNRLILGAGERAEIVVDLRGLEGETLYFAHYGEELITPPHTADDFDESNLVLFTIKVTAPTANSVTAIPLTLNDIVRLDRSQAVLTRTLVLNIPPSINLKTFDMNVINISTTLGTKEIWSIINQSEEPHPIHIHDSPFQIIARNGELPPVQEMGWKDTVIVHPLERVDLLKEFSAFADPNGPFMYHCHILDHEDKGMMGQFVIRENAANYLPIITH
ncbi:MAG: multicopper oxidase domain-containing protein [Caldilineaceae bacterium]